MRNITSTFSHTFSPPSSSPSARANREDCALSFRCVNTPVSDSEDGNATLEENFSAIAFDLDEDGRFWGVREGLNEEGMVIVTVWEGHMGETKDDMKLLARLPPSSAAPSAQSPHLSRTHRQVLEFKHLPEEESLCLILAGGDIVTISLDEARMDEEDEPSNSATEVVGSFPSPGILSACFSPDLELLVLITSDTQSPTSSTPSSPTLIVMTRQFTPIYESPLWSSEKGEEEMVNVGWGRKETQFHGKAGKEAALSGGVVRMEVDGEENGQQKAVDDLVGDDGLPRISWRGDGLYFSINSLDPIFSTAKDGAETFLNHRRQVRVYSRNPEIALSTTSEAIMGLEASTSWRPSGNLIASVQRFGPSGSNGGLETGEGGDRGRCDIIFLERNGLRHGEFRLREDKLERYVEGAREVKKGRKEGIPKFEVRELAWNSDSTILAVWISRYSRDESQTQLNGDHIMNSQGQKDSEQDQDSDVVQLWTTNNYHWYLKQEWKPKRSFHEKSTGGKKGSAQQITGRKEKERSAKRFEGLMWHPEKADELWLISKNQLQRRRFAWETVLSSQNMPQDTGTVAVVDGSRILLTPFRTQNVPPPMSSYNIECPSTPVHICIPPQRDQIAAVFDNGTYMIWDLATKLPKKGKRGGGKVAEPELILELIQPKEQSPHDTQWQQISVTSNNEVALLMDDGIFWYQAGLDGFHRETGADSGFCGRIIPGGREDHILIDEKGSVEHEMPDEASNFPPGAIPVEDPEDPPIYSLDILTNPLESFCFDIQRPISYPNLFFGRTRQNKLYAVDLTVQNTTEHMLISSECTSMTTTPDFLIWTISSHDSKYAPLAEISEMLHQPGQLGLSDRQWESRRVERGSQIVTAVPSSMALVLQMPRGNLETINPRPLVLAVVKKDVALKDYRSAFLHCRTHRIDLNIIYDLAPETFLNSIPEFVKQIPEVDYLNLFISGLKNENLAHTLYKQSTTSEPDFYVNKVNTVCDAVRVSLEAKDLLKYVDTIMTTHVCKTPPDLEAGLDVLRGLKTTNPDAVEEAVKYIIFLTDVNRLYDVALGMYDFQLVLLVAQFSQRDPKEYLPFLRELRALPKFYQRFRIDNHLERYESALGNLRQAGDEHFEEVADYVRDHNLYQTAFILYEEQPDRMQVMRELYADYLMESGSYSQAAQVYEQASASEKAMDAYESAHSWQELLALAQKQYTATAELSDRCDRLADYLGSHNRHKEAAQVFLQYRQDVEQAVHVLCRGSEFEDARNLIELYSRTDLIETEIYPGLDDANEQTADVFDEMDAQLDKEMTRLVELDAKLAEDSDAFFMIENEPVMDNVDVMTEATTATGFTRFTAARSNVTGTSKNTAKSRRLGRKKAKGRKGTVDEFEYLLASLVRLAQRVEEKTTECESLLKALEITSDEYRTVAEELRDKVGTFRQKLQDSLVKAWQQKAGVDEAKKVAFGEDEALAALVAQHMATGESMAVEEQGTKVEDVPVVGEMPVLQPWTIS